MQDLDYITIGMVLDMITSKSNEDGEDEKGVKVATQGDFDKF
jgi:hypothetical protein